MRICECGFLFVSLSNVITVTFCLTSKGYQSTHLETVNVAYILYRPSLVGDILLLEIVMIFCCLYCIMGEV